MESTRALAPAGTRIRASDLGAWGKGAMHAQRAREALADDFRERLGVPHVFFVSSGRAAMTIVLSVLRELSPKADELVAPGYTCYSVAASGVRAGLRIRPLDVDPATLDYRPGALETIDPSRVLALTSANLYGLPNDLPRLEAFCRDRGIFLVDDAAQALGARVGGRFAGTFGDVGVYSFDKGKNITTLQGGVVVCRDDALAGRLAEAFDALPEPPVHRTAVQSLSLLAYALLLRPALYRLPDSLLTLGETPFELDYPTTRLSAYLAPLAARLLDRLDDLTVARRERAKWYRSLLGSRAALRLVEERDSFAVYPRFPIVFEEPEVRDAVARVLRTQRLGATASYPHALADVPDLAPHLAPDLVDTPGARRLAAGILTLPTHAYVTEADVRRIVHELNAAMHSDDLSSSLEVSA